MTKTADTVVLVLLPLSAAAATIAYGADKFIATTLFFGLPIAYLTIRRPGIFRKSLIFAFFFSLPLSIFVDTLAVYDGAWYVPHSIAPFRLFGAATLEIYWFGLLWVLLAVLFYEHLSGQSISRPFSPAYRWLLALFALLVIIVPVLYLIDAALLAIPYFYLWMSLVFVMPMLVWFLVRYPAFLPRFISAGAYFSFLLLLFELTALHQGLWTFPGKHFIGWIELFGYRFPLEEFVFWIIFATPSLLAYYEYFADDRKL
ncbi:MAG: hypothetical protein KGI69_01135 [Patescibacteria group bacterium]|nr:hypothetical protein [Patescibacteria group bacterium]